MTNGTRPIELTATYKTNENYNVTYSPRISLLRETIRNSPDLAVFLMMTQNVNVVAPSKFCFSTRTPRVVDDSLVAGDTHQLPVDPSTIRLQLKPTPLHDGSEDV